MSLAPRQHYHASPREVRRRVHGVCALGSTFEQLGKCTAVRAPRAMQSLALVWRVIIVARILMVLVGLLLFKDE